MNRAAVPLVLYLAIGAPAAAAQEPGATINVRVVTVADRPAGVTIRLRTYPDRAVIGEQESDAAAFAGLQAGVYRVTVEQSGSNPVDSLVRVSPGESAMLVATLTPASADPPRSQLVVEERRGGTPGHTLGAEAIRSLPSSNSIDALVESTQAELIGDRLETGGLSVGDPMRIGSHGSSWTQTTYRFGDAELMDPLDGGRPALLPDVNLVSQVEVTNTLMPIERGAPGPDITLVPRRPTTTWQRSIEGAIADPGLVARNDLTDPPAVARLGTWEFANAFLSGPLIPNRLGAVFAASWTGSTRFQRAGPDSVDASAASAFAHLVFAVTPNDELRAVVMAQRRHHPFSGGVAFGQQGGAGSPGNLGNPGNDENDDAVHLQGTWERRAHSGLSWNITASFLRRQLEPASNLPALLYVDRLRDGPVPDLLSQSASTRQAWSFAARMTPGGTVIGGRSHAFRYGVEVGGASVRADAPISARAAELVAGIPARVWQYDAPGTSEWHDTTLAAYAADQIALRPQLNLEGGLRFEATSAAAQGATQGIRWYDWLPRFSVRWQPLEIVDATLFAGAGRYGYRLPLGALAYGDPYSATGRVYRWLDSNHDGQLQPNEVGSLVARVGPGSGGDARFSAIDPNLRKPQTDEFVMGVEVRSPASFLFRLSGIARRDRNLMAPVNTGVPLAGYSLISLPDPGVDIATGASSQLLPIYNRLPATFGADRYLLTNPDGLDATFIGAEATAQRNGERFQMLVGVTAGRSDAVAANRGFNAVENDLGLLGEAYTNPNAATFARGRPFTERGYTIKASGTYRFPREVTLGVIGRYQDGQHFSRIVIAPSLNQGPEPVRAFPNGLTRFAYTVTVDARLQRHFEIGGHGIDGLIDVFNLLNLANEVEENSVTGPASRMPTAVQPPLAIHLGLRWFF
jgi:hypothetical protein